jgi:hypothetical protein
MLRVRVRSAQLALVLGCVTVLSAAFLLTVGSDALADRNPFQFFADSRTYMRIYAGEQSLANDALLSVSDNYVGPLLVLRIMRGNIYLVMLFNVVLFWLSTLTITAALRLDPLKVGGLLLLSPLTISSLLSVNKEIFVLPFMALAILGYTRRSWTTLLLALGASVLVRWQLTAFFLIALAASTPIGRVGRRRVLVILLLLGLSSAAYLLLSNVFAAVIAVVERSVLEDFDQGSGLFTVLNAYQQRGLYFLVFPLKAAHLLFALGLRVDRFLHPTNIYNDLFVGLHCTVTLVALLGLISRRLLTLRSDLIFASLMFLVVFCLSPIYAPRYLYPVFVTWVLVLSGAPFALASPRRQRMGLALSVPVPPQLSGSR